MKTARILMVALIGAALLSWGSAQAALIGYYEFENNLNDSTSNGNNAVASQNPGEVGFVGGGFRGTSGDINDPAANGGSNTGGSVDIPINVSPTGVAATNNFSFGGWFNLDSNAGFPGVMANDHGGWDRGIHMNGNQWGIASGGNTNNIAPGTTGVWTYVVGTFDKNANVATLYVGSDNPLVQTTASGSRPDGAAVNGGLAVLELGRYDNQDLDAKVDDIMVWNQALNVHEANGIRNLRLSTLDYNPLQAEQLFNLFNAGAGMVTIGDLTWEATSGLDPTRPGEVLANGDGSYTIVLNTLGQGLIGRAPAVPEPMTAMMLALGLGAGLMRRRRKA